MVIVKVKEGLLEGQEHQLVTGDGKYYSFKGIPYAQSPLGPLRFKAPLPPKPWTGVRKALEHGFVCDQCDIFTNSLVPGSEDCLYLNVYSMDVRPGVAPAPVMFWIHGGGYKSGSGDSDLYGPDFLVQRGVVLVTINYRLEVLGFLCLDTADVPGNAGLKDQAAALRWVRDNIASFGGDPGNVTIFGESAGGASVGFHLLSPLSAGLFHRAILMSGTPLCEWAYTYEPRRRALRLARELGASADTLADPKRLLAFLQAVPLERLINPNIAITLQESYGQPIHNFSFCPVAEKEFGDEQQFLTYDVIDSLKRGMLRDVNVMIGYTSQECIVMTPYLSKNFDVIDRHIECLLPNNIARNSSAIENLHIADKIKKRYVGEKTITKDVIEEMIEHLSWRMVKYAVLKFLQFSGTTKSPKYLYKFSCKSERNVNEEYLGNGLKFKGVSHLDDLLYLFDQPVHNLPLNKDSQSYKMIQQTTILWTNFAKYGNPTPDGSLGVKWSPYTEQEGHYLDIGEQLVPGTHLDEDEFRFWDQIYSSIN